LVPTSLLLRGRSRAFFADNAASSLRIRLSLAPDIRRQHQSKRRTKRSTPLPSSCFESGGTTQTRKLRCGCYRIWPKIARGSGKIFQSRLSSVPDATGAKVAGPSRSRGRASPVCFDVLLFVLPIRLAFLAESARTRLNDEVRSTGSRRACPDVAIVRGAKGICPQLRFHTRPKRSL
jgi:hypothetical protein